MRGLDVSLAISPVGVLLLASVSLTTTERERERESHVKNRYPRKGLNRKAAVHNDLH